MDESERLRDTDKIRVKWRPKQTRNKTTKLGDVVKQIMENRISPQQAKFGLIAEAWSQLLPAELHRHCKIADISSGQLKILVDSPSYVHELRLCGSELLEELQRRCPRAKIEKIKFIIG